MSIAAELLVFSGLPNPELTLDDAEAAGVAFAVAQSLAGGLTATDDAQRPVLGYRGFRLSSDDLGIDGVLVLREGVVVATPEGLQAASDSAGCQDLLLAAARAHGLGDILDEAGVTPEIA